MASKSKTPRDHARTTHGHVTHIETTPVDAHVVMATDPVCGMTVDPHRAALKAEHGGRTYYFCSAGCRAKFIADPAKYLDASARRPLRSRAEGTIYTCPMHPEIRQAGPGSCPICGMALEPLMATADSGPNPELVDMTRRFWIGLVADAAGVRAGDGRAPHRSAHAASASQASNWIQLALATPVVLWAGWPFFVRGWQSLRDAQPQHVHADRPGHRRGLALQRRRDACCPASFRRPSAKPTARSRSISRRRR